MTSGFDSGGTILDSVILGSVIFAFSDIPVESFLDSIITSGVVGFVLKTLAPVDFQVELCKSLFFSFGFTISATFASMTFCLISSTIFLPCASNACHFFTHLMILEISACFAGVSFDKILSSIETFAFVIAPSINIQVIAPVIPPRICHAKGSTVPPIIAPVVAHSMPLYFLNIPFSFIAL